jgi:phage shock protein A
MSKKPRAAAATAAAAMAASSADELDDYMRRVEIVGSLLDLNGEAREIDASTPSLTPENALLAGGLGGLEGKHRTNAKKQAERKRLNFKKARDEVRACAMGASTSAASIQVGTGPMLVSAMSSPPFRSPVNPRQPDAEAKAKRLAIDKKNRGKTISRRDDAIDALKAQVTGLESDLADFRAQCWHLRAQLQGIDNERAQLEDELEQYMSDNPSEEVDDSFKKMHHELKTWEDGRYADTVRLIYYTQLQNGVAAENVKATVVDILRVLGISHGALPGPGCTRLMNMELAIGADFDAAELLLRIEDGRGALAGDEAAKLGKSRFALGAFSEVDGPGSPIMFAALGVVDALGGTAVETTAAIKELLQRLTDNHRLLQSFTEESVTTVLDDFVKKFSATMSDSCAAQRCVNELMLDMFAQTSARGGSPNEVSNVRGDLKSFYCWLHEAINLCKATTKGLSFAKQCESLEAIEKAGLSE